MSLRRLSSFFPHPLSSFTLPSSLSIRALSLSCCERQWNITATLRFDASTHSEEHTLLFWCSSVLSLLLLFA